MKMAKLMMRSITWSLPWLGRALKATRRLSLTFRASKNLTLVSGGEMLSETIDMV